MGRTCKTPHWQGNIPTTPLCGGQVAPPASMSLLFAARDLVEGCWLTYSQPALCYEGNTAGLEVRQIAFVVGPATRHGVVVVTRCPQGTAGTNDETTVQGTTDTTEIGDILPLFTGDEVYLQAGTACSTGFDVGSSSALNDSAGAGTDRAILLPEYRHATVEQLTITRSAGCGLVTFERTPDLELL